MATTETSTKIKGFVTMFLSSSAMGGIGAFSRYIEAPGIFIAMCRSLAGLIMMTLIFLFTQRFFKLKQLKMSGGMALALVLMSLNDSSAMSLNSFLFGSIVTITTEQILFLLVITLAIILLYIFFRRPMYVLTFDEETAFTSGLPVRTMSIAFNIITGMTIAIVMPIVGALLVSAILILPAAISMRLSKSFNGVILIGIVVAMFGMFGGLVLSYYVGTPPGATITLIFIALFAIMLMVERLLGKS